MKLTSIIAGVLTLAVLGTLYKRMIERETPEPVGKADELIAVAVRLPMIAGHMAMNMVMAEYLGRAGSNRLAGKGPGVLYCILAFVVPVFIHTFFDGATTGNKFLFESIGADNQMNTVIGGVMAAAAVIGIIAFQIWIIVRFKKKASEFSAMKLLPEAE